MRIQPKCAAACTTVRAISPFFTQPRPSVVAALSMRILRAAARRQRGRSYPRALRDIASGEGDLTRRLETQGKDELAAIATSFNQFVDKIAKVLVSIRESSESVRLASTEIASGNQDLSARTEQQAGSLEETAAAMEELTATVQQNAANARQANELATGASQVASHASTVVGQVVETMGRHRCIGPQDRGHHWRH